jgi:multiple sugar transport system permease protein
MVTIFPTIYSLGLSLFKWEITLEHKPFIGLGNYIQLFQDERFLHSILVTAFITVVGVSVELVVGFAFAELVFDKMRGQRIIVALMLLPVMIMPVVVGSTWRLLWDTQYGPINQIIGWIIGRPFHFVWLAQTPSALFAIIVTEIWQWTPFMFLVILSGLATLDVELFEAADIDGASAWSKFWHLTLPLIQPILIVALLIRGLDCLKSFDIIFTTTRGGPGTSTETITLYIYTVGYKFFRLGYGAAASFILLILLVVVLTRLLKVLRATWD